MIDFIKGLIAILITVLLVSSCATAPSAMVPELPSDDAIFEQLIDAPLTEQDLLHNSIVFEFLYVNQKLQTYNLMKYISTIAKDNKSYELYDGKSNEIKKLYGI